MRSFMGTIRNSIQTPVGKRDYNRGLFDRVAGEYDAATRLMSLWRDASWKRRLVELLPAIDNPRCIDLACGTGDVTLLLANKYPKADIIGVDLTPAMLEVAQSRSRHACVRFVEADMCRLNVPDQWADIVTGSYALRNAAELDEALREIKRVLKPGGYAAFLDFRKSENKSVSAIQLGVLKYWCGFCSVLVHGAPEHAYIAESLRQFPSCEKLAHRFAAHGFDMMRREPLMGGMTEIIIAASA